MLNRTGITLATVVVLVIGPGCDVVTGPDPLAQFTWNEVDEGVSVADGIQSASVGGEIILLGGINTPTRCYSLSPDFQQDGQRLTLRVDAKTTNTPNCEQTPGGYTYTAVIRRLDNGTYQLTVIHAVTGGTTLQFADTVAIG
ncbi:MAG: hypothetical protein ACREL7_11815 [Longimicrobiales bacterium]